MEIAERKDVINQLWIDLKDLAEARTQALSGAKEIHTFDRDALDTKERIQVYYDDIGGLLTRYSRYLCINTGFDQLLYLTGKGCCYIR